MQNSKPHFGTTTLIFDLDGTLIDSSPGIGHSLQAAFRAAGKEWPSVDMRSVVGPPIRVMARSIAPALNAQDLQVIEREFRAHYDTVGWSSVSAFDGVIEGLHKQREAGIRLFIVTNKPRIPTRKILAEMGVISLFEVIVTRDSRVPAYVSKDEMLAVLIHQSQLDSRASVMVGDTFEDQQAARENNMHFIHARYGYGRVPDALLHLDSFSNLEAILAQRESES